jgi:hypothetical protein
VDWEAYLASLDSADRPRAQRLVEEYGQEAASRYVRYHRVGPLDELAARLQQDRVRVRTRVSGLYESIDVNWCPHGWRITNDSYMQDGTRIVRTDVTDPDGASGYFVRGFNAAQQRIELREAFLILDGMTSGLRKWVTGVAVELVEGRGIMTHLYFTLYQFKLLRVPVGHEAPPPEGGVVFVSSFRMYTIWNLETILHLHWLRERYPAASLDELIAHTASVRYAEDDAIQCGYRVAGVTYVPADEGELPCDAIMAEYEGGNPNRRAQYDGMLAEFSFTRQTVMKQNFDIELAVVPVGVA